MKMMKRWMSRVTLMLVALLLVGSLLPTQASALSYSDAVTVCAALNDNGDVIGYQPGIPVLSGGEKLMVTNDDFYSNRYIYGAYVDGGEVVLLDYVNTGYGMAFFSFNYSKNSVFMTEGQPVIGETYIALAMDSDMNIGAYNAVIKDYDSEALPNGWYALTVEHNVPRNYHYPVAIVSEEGELMAIISEDGPIAFVQPKSAGLAGLFRGKGLILIIGVGALAVLAVVVFLILRKPNDTGNVQIEIDGDRTVMGDINQNIQGGNMWENIPQGTGVCLVDNSGTLGGTKFPVSHNGMLIGRAMEADVRYPADTKGVSRNHCRVYYEGSTLMVMDLGSKSGTYVLHKGQLRPNTPTSIHEGDVICLGSKKISLQVKKG